MSVSLCYIASLVKISNKFNYISESYVQKSVQKQPKIVPSPEDIWNFQSGELQIRHKYVSAQICTNWIILI